RKGGDAHEETHDVGGGCPAFAGRCLGQSGRGGRRGRRQGPGSGRGRQAGKDEQEARKEAQEAQERGHSRRSKVGGICRRDSQLSAPPVCPEPQPTQRNPSTRDDGRGSDARAGPAAMTATADVRLTIDAPLAWVEVNRPAAHNALNLAVWRG